MAEREGFEPSVEFWSHTRLAGEHLRPLGHLSARSHRLENDRIVVRQSRDYGKFFFQVFNVTRSGPVTYRLKSRW